MDLALSAIKHIKSFVAEHHDMAQSSPSWDNLEPFYNGGLGPGKFPWVFPRLCFRGEGDFVGFSGSLRTLPSLALLASSVPCPHPGVASQTAKRSKENACN